MDKLILTLMLALCGTLANAQENFYDGPRRTFSSGAEDIMVYSKRYAARCRVCLTGKYDDSKKNFTEFALFVAYSYNPSPGTKRRFDFHKNKVFKTQLPVNGKKRFKMLANIRKVWGYTRPLLSVFAYIGMISKQFKGNTNIFAK